MNKRSSAITMIELLIVIVILSVIAALMFPVLSAAKQSAKDSSSQSNLRQIGNAYLLYCSDYDDRTPYVGEQSVIVRLRLGLANPDDYPQYEGQIQIAEALAPYTHSELLWRSPAAPKSFQAIQYDFDTITYDFCSGYLTELEQPSNSPLLRENMAFRRGRAFAWRADGSSKLLPWDEVVAELTRSQQTFCPERVPASPKYCEAEVWNSLVANGSVELFPDRPGHGQHFF